MMIIDLVSRVFGERAAARRRAHDRFMARMDSGPWGLNAEAGDDTALGEQAPPFVLVAHDVEGRWDVYAKRFDTPLASFEERQPACNYACRIARTRKDTLVLMRDPARMHSPENTVQAA
jgi:hypothetical protein